MTALDQNISYLPMKKKILQTELSSSNVESSDFSASDTNVINETTTSRKMKKKKVAKKQNNKTDMGRKKESISDEIGQGMGSIGGDVSDWMRQGRVPWAGMFQME